MNFDMTRKDLIELYQLISLYKRTYPLRNADAVADLMNEISSIYSEITGNDIRTAHNPRLAGRHPKYDNAIKERILLLHSTGSSHRAISSEIGCSYGYVQKILKGI